MKLLNFQSQKLVVDYISFKFQHLDNFKQKEIINYLFKLGFNSYQQSAKLAQPIKESLRFSSKNKFDVSTILSRLLIIIHAIAAELKIKNIDPFNSLKYHRNLFKHTRVKYPPRVHS